APCSRGEPSPCALPPSWARENARGPKRCIARTGTSSAPAGSSASSSVSRPACSDPSRPCSEARSTRSSSPVPMPPTPSSAPSPASRGERGAFDIRSALDRTENSLTRLEADQRRWRTNRDRHAEEVRRLDAELAEARSVLGELEGRIAAAADRLREIGAQERA